MRTMIGFQIAEGKILKPEVIVLGKPGALPAESSVFREGEGAIYACSF